MFITRSLLSLTFIVFVAVTAIFLAVPNPELDWDAVLRDARSFMDERGFETPDDTPLLGLKVAITGATSGIGLGLTRKLASLGAELVVFGRSSDKLKALQEEMPNNIIDTVWMDLRDLSTVSDAADHVAANHEYIDVLINNAGVHTAGKGVLTGMLDRTTTKQGYDETFGVNYLGHFLLTAKLMPVLDMATKPKIVQTSSGYHMVVDGSDLRTMSAAAKDPVASEKGGSHGFVLFRNQRQYANSKLAQILHARSLQDHYNITAVSIDPTWVSTQIGGKKGTPAYEVLSRTAFSAEGFGVSSILHAILDTTSSPARDFYSNTQFLHVNEPGDSSIDAWADRNPWMYEKLPIRDLLLGVAPMIVLPLQRFFPQRDTVYSSAESYDRVLRDELWEWSARAVKPFF